MAQIHPTAIVSPESDLADDVQIGPGCVLTGPVTLGPGVRLLAHAYLAGPVTIGAGSIIYPFVSIGLPPQDLKFGPDDQTAGVSIGQRCTIREQASIHAATNADTPTRVGDELFMMVNAHIGHDARVGDRVIMVNNACVGGHGIVGDHVNLAGNALVHQHTRVGRLAFIAGMTGVSADCPPYCMTVANNTLLGINVVGMRRSGFARDEISAMRRVFREGFRANLPREELQAMLDERGRGCAPIAELAEFVRTATRAICHTSARGGHLQAES